MKQVFGSYLLSVVLWSVAAQAEPIVVRSGEHENFTRLVMQIPNDTDWSIERSNRTTTLSLTEFDGGFDLSVAFAIIPRTRLAALVASESQLELQLVCDCEIASFLEQNGFLVLDIIDAEAETAVVQHPSSKLPDSPFSHDDLLWARDQNDDGQPEEIISGSEETMIQSLDESTKAQRQNSLVAKMQTQLLESFSNAASRGIVSPKQERLTIAENVTDKPPESGIFDSSQIVAEPAVVPVLNIRVTNSSDVPPDFDEQVALTGSVCPAPNIVEIASWGGEESFGEQFAASNQRLYDELGRLNDDEVIARSRLYLFFGFGAEAKQTLGLLPNTASDYPELYDLAYYFEHGFMQNPRSLHRFADCESDLALWGILSAKSLPLGRSIDAKAALRALEKLPGHLKYFLAQDLSERLLDRGDIENASVAIRSFERLENSNTDAPNLASIKAEDMRGEVTETSESLGAIVETGNADSPRALVELIDRYVEEDATIPADVALLAEAYAFELQNAPEGPEMLRAHILSSAKSHQFEKAFDTLSAEAERLSDDAKDQLQRYVSMEFTTTAGDADFMLGYFDRIKPVQGMLGSEEKALIANRLLDLGFATQALELLQSISSEQRLPSAQKLKAEARLQLGDYAGALQEALGIESPDADIIRGEAMHNLGENETAIEYFTKAEQTDRAIAVMWNSEEWSALIDQTDPVFGQITQIANSKVDQIEADDTMLQKTDNAIQSSATARQAISSLLNQLALSE